MSFDGEGHRWWWLLRKAKTIAGQRPEISQHRHGCRICELTGCVGRYFSSRGPNNAPAAPPRGGGPLLDLGSLRLPRVPWTSSNIGHQPLNGADLSRG